MREVTAAIIRRNGKILICRRAEGSCAHLWEFPGGKTELGETPFECLTRELREELNIEIKRFASTAAVFAENFRLCLSRQRSFPVSRSFPFTRKCGGYCRMSSRHLNGVRRIDRWLRRSRKAQSIQIIPFARRRGLLYTMLT